MIKKKKIEAEGREFANSNSERSVQFLQHNAFLTCSGGFSDLIFRTIRIQIGKNNWDLETYRKN